jgi:4-amino-4-deoxychorismate lyase
MNLVNGVATSAISIDDRGLAYGDGVFRTLVLRNGLPAHWARHYAKLAADCSALGIRCPLEDALRRDLEAVGRDLPDCVARIVVTRGSGPRGYRPPDAAAPTRIVTSHPLSRDPDDHRKRGVRVHMCRIRLAVQPALAGIKHLNRLENVLAQAEWARDPAIAEGIMLDADGNLAGGTMSNLFLVVDGSLITPRVDRCGVAGVQRARVLEYAKAKGIAANEAVVRVDQLLASDEIFLVNSVISLWPVIQVGAKQWSVGALTSAVARGLEETEH